MILEYTLMSYLFPWHLQTYKITQEKKLIAEKEVKTDILTGLLNRRSYYEVSSVEYQRLLRHNSVLSAILFYIDDFKKINDTYGHHAEDY